MKEDDQRRSLEGKVQSREHCWNSCTGNKICCGVEPEVNVIGKLSPSRTKHSVSEIRAYFHCQYDV